MEFSEEISSKPMMIPLQSQMPKVLLDEFNRIIRGRVELQSVTKVTSITKEVIFITERAKVKQKIQI